MIETTLTRAQAEDLYEKESALYGCGFYKESPEAGIPLYRIGELFGMRMLKRFIDGQGINYIGGRDFGTVGGYDDDPILDVIHFRGFLRIVCQHNCWIAHERQRGSKAGSYLETLEIARSARLEASEAEEQRKREERKAKRAASRKAKQEAAEQAVSA